MFLFFVSGSAEKCLVSPVTSHSEAELPLPPQISTSPGLNKSFCFQREPPEGCEKVRVWEEFRYFLLILLSVQVELYIVQMVFNVGITVNVLYKRFKKPNSEVSDTLGLFE